MSVKTLVEPGRGYEIMTTYYGELPIIHPPIVLPAPKPGAYRTTNPKTFQEEVKWVWHLWKVGPEGRRMATNHVKGEFRHRWFRFKLTHGITKDDRSWLFKQDARKGK